MLLTIPSAFAAPTSLTLYTASSEPFAAYVAGPKNAGKGVVLVHDWFGVSPFYTDATDRLAKDGYRVVAVDLYGGHHATTHEEAGKLLESVHEDLAGREIDAALKWLSDGGRSTAIMGFSMGAKHALAAAMRNHSVQATVLWYGETSKDPEKLKQLGGPVLSIVGSHDGATAAEDSAAFSKAADVAGVGSEVF